MNMMRLLSLCLTVPWALAQFPAVKNRTNVLRRNRNVGERKLQEQAVDLSQWFAESYTLYNPGNAPSVGNARWTVADDKLSVFQSRNGPPSLFCSDFSALGTAVQGRIRVETNRDDDFIGFALGFNPGDTTNPNADYLLIDWKMATDPPNPTLFGLIGAAVSRVTGIPSTLEFWKHTDEDCFESPICSPNMDCFESPLCSPLGEGLEELERAATLGEVGWERFTDYNFRFEYTATELRVFVDGNLEATVSGGFGDGRMCFYNASQERVRYSGFTIEALPTAAPSESPIETPSEPTPGSTVDPTPTPVTEPPPPPSQAENTPEPTEPTPAVFSFDFNRYLDDKEVKELFLRDGA